MPRLCGAFLFSHLLEINLPILTLVIPINKFICIGNNST